MSLELTLKLQISSFYWNTGKFKWSFALSSSNLPELCLSTGFSAFTWFSKHFCHHINDTLYQYQWCSVKSIDVLANLSKKSKGDQFLESMLNPGETMWFKRECLLMLWSTYCQANAMSELYSNSKYIFPMKVLSLPIENSSHGQSNQRWQTSLEQLSISKIQLISIQMGNCDRSETTTHCTWARVSVHVSQYILPPIHSHA